MSIYRVITGTLKARTAVHVGSGRGSDVTDALVRRDTTGAPVIPGTAIAGALRGRLTRLAPGLGHRQCKALDSVGHQPGNENEKTCACPVCHLFGDVNPPEREVNRREESQEPDERAGASRVLIFDASLIIGQGESSPDGPALFGGPIRDGVGIERMAGTAYRQGAVKFDLEVLPAGTEFSLRMELRDTRDTDEELMAAGLAEWQRGHLWLGGRVARGLGGFALNNIKFTELDLGDPQKLVNFLKSDRPWEHGEDVTTRLIQQRLEEARQRVAGTEGAQDQSPAVSRRWVSATFTLEAEGFFLTNDTTAAAASGFDHAPLLADQKSWQCPVLPGASLRGALRSHSERIARTLATLNAESPQEFQQCCPACDPHARRAQKDQPPLELESCDSLLTFDKETGGEKEVGPEKQCLACRLFGSTRLGSRLLVEDAPLVGDPAYKMLDFLAVDRFTGGGSDGLKFDALALWQPAFEVRLFLDNPEDWELGWLALTLRDLWDGLIPVGFGASKGFGRVKIAPSGWRVRLAFLKESDFPGLPQVPREGPGGSDLYDGVYRYAECGSDQPAQTRREWLGLARSWAKSFLEAVKSQPRWDEMPIHNDTYFGINDGVNTLEQLYPKEILTP